MLDSKNRSMAGGTSNSSPTQPGVIGYSRVAGRADEAKSDAPAALCTVVVPVCNKEKYIEAALRSVCSQTHPSLEVIVVDDGSSDRSSSIASAINDPRIFVIRQENRGVSAARNRAVSMATGEFIFFLDADDRWHPQHVELTVLAFERFPEAALVAADFHLLRDSEVDLFEFESIKAVDVDIVDDLAMMWMSIGRQRFCTPTTAVRSDILRSLGPPFPEETSIGEDIYVWFRINEHWRFALIRQQLNLIRHDTPNSLTRRNEASWAVPPWVCMLEKAAGEGRLRGSLAKSWPAFAMRHHMKRALQMAAAGDTRTALSRLFACRRYAVAPRWWATLVLVLLPGGLRRTIRSVWASRVARTSAWN